MATDGGFKMENNNCAKITTDTCVKIPQPLSILYISESEDFRYWFMVKKPNLWWRFWQYFLLGWRWKDVNSVSRRDI